MNQLTPITTLGPPDNADPAGYELDFALWINTQLTLLREMKSDQLDLEHVIEEFESMGRSERRELASWLEVLLMHLLKCEFQANHKSRSWLSTIIAQRSAILRHLEQSPSLRQHVGPVASKAYGTAVALAANQTGLDKSNFPAENPYTQQQILDPDFLP